MFCSQMLREPFLISNGFFRSRSPFPSDGYSTARTKTLSPVDFLIHSLRTSNPKVTDPKSTSDFDLVINVFKNYGLDDTQIRDIVSSAPYILRADPRKTLEPKIKVFLEIGLSVSDLVKLIKKSPDIFRYGLHTRIIPSLEFLRNLVGSDENVIEVINKSRWLLFTNNAMRRISANVLLLRSYGLLDDRIVKFVVSNPERLKVKPELLKRKLHYVKEKLGISPGSRGFIYGINSVLYCTESEIEEKMQVFKRFGWSDSEVSSLLKFQPCCLSKSEANISDKLNFLMNELGYTPSYLTSYHSFFTLSLEKRVKPRNQILNILKEKNLVKKNLSLISVSTYSELKFIDFLQRFESDIPGLCESYMSSVRSKSKDE